ncbi:sensor histidine kinase [Adhaeribacter rhizoryzae]|uniref:histidine kinase n=1 Tax=Adhaeribacter rhizoryzae TaxID=2607907 RepID=A0A5M6CUJ2_9BACT|nr:HAMP domain-containing sensor histidine kinase [Adhaeribacter rhizoryzae]KAA5538616.1 PAS domain S-box protein [Adhaeribacter rhizoryzae]
MPHPKYKRRLLFESLFENAGVGLALVAKEGIPFRVNAKLCALLGYSEQELVETSFEKYTHPEDIEKDLDLFKSLLLGEIEVYEIEKRYIKKNGQVFWGLLTVSMAPPKEGAVTLIGMVQDIDARKCAEAELLKSEKLLLEHNAYKDKLFSLIAHDLRGSIGSNASLLSFIENNHASLSKEEIVKYISLLNANGSQTLEMLDNLLAWSQSQFKEKRFEPAILSLSQAIIKVSEQLQQQAKLKNNSIQVLISANLEVCADEQMLHVILRNLLSNAIKFSYSGKTITVTAIQDSSFVYVTVTDKGVGISERNIAKLLNNNREGFTSYGTKGEKGTGLGLNLCLQYIEQHGGDLQINSEVGKGSRFTFSIPAAEQE